MRTSAWLFIVGALLFVFGIGFIVVGARAARDVPAAAIGPTLAPVASMKQLMNGIVNPAATVVFESVSSTSSERGIEETFPRNDAEWAAVGDAAAALGEAGNLLMLEGRAVDTSDWMTMSRALVEAGRQVQLAVDAKSPEAVLNAGGVVYTACDNCHKRYQR